ncbi:MAG: ferritin [Sporomusaceae bacterium]|nr:ferritin [Sporomusaceae bacterium]
MINEKVQNAFNKQIQKEFYSAYLYLAMSAYSEEKNLKGFAHWLKVQYEEERAHALKLMDYLSERGGKVLLEALEAPEHDFGSPVETFEAVVKHEQSITESINKLYEVALKEKDYAAQIFLQWYITEQVEEEASATAVLERLKTVGDKGSAILYIDKELGKRAAE